MSRNKVEVKVCTQCKVMFQTTMSTDLCPVCQNIMNRLFGKVKTYIRTHKTAGIQEVAEDCHVSSKQILEWIREERLYFDESSQVALPCLECGTLINSGKYCDSCKKNYIKSLVQFAILQRKSQSILKQTVLLVSKRETD